MVPQSPKSQKIFSRSGQAALVLALALGATPAAPALAAPSDPAAAQIETLDARLLAVMKDAKSLGFHGRYNKLKPAVEAALDLPTMTRFAVGPSWSTMTEAQHQALINAFTRMTVSTYAHNFDGYGGEKFVLGDVQTRGPDKLVLTKIVQSNGKTVNLTYRMRQAGSSWKVIDVYYQGSVSELTTRRSDFASTLAKGGAPALVDHLNALSDKLAK
jgi:phospholipid transport system substrate-binding protein